MAQDLSSASGAALIPAAALAHVPGCAAGALPHAIVQLHGGTLNTSFRVDTPAGRFVLRLNAAMSEFLGVDHEREAQLQSAAAACGLAPSLVYADMAHNFTISTFIDGRTWEAADFARQGALHRLGTRLRVLHGIAPPDVVVFDIGAIVREYGARLTQAAPAEAGLVAKLLRRSEATLALCASSGRKACVVHNDLHHSNLIEADQLYFIDWEYAAVADPIFDLACVLAYYPQAQPHARLLLDSAGLACAASPEALLAASSLFVLISFLWYRLRRLTGVPAAPADFAAEAALLARLNA